ncbi:MAG: hypothetical protein IJ476_02730, partial [Bacteroidales bacterium]|nr:hypothetical protein [Bacteroidales bacterium]
MKNIIILTIIMLLSISNIIHAQDSNGLYLITNAKKINIKEYTNSNSSGYSIRYISKGDEYYKDSILTFNLYLSTREYEFWKLWHFYMIKPKACESAINPKDQHKTFLKDSSFLNIVECLYWDDIRDLDYGDARDYIGSLL